MFSLRSRLRFLRPIALSTPSIRHPILNKRYSLHTATAATPSLLEKEKREKKDKDGWWFPFMLNTILRFYKPLEKGIDIHNVWVIKKMENPSWFGEWVSITNEKGEKGVLSFEQKELAVKAWSAAQSLDPYHHLQLEDVSLAYLLETCDMMGKHVYLFRYSEILHHHVECKKFFARSKNG